MIDNVWAGKTAELEQQRQLELASAAGKSGGSVVRLSEKSFGVAQAAAATATQPVKPARKYFDAYQAQIVIGPDGEALHPADGQEDSLADKLIIALWCQQGQGDEDGLQRCLLGPYVASQLDSVIDYIKQHQHSKYPVMLPPIDVPIISTLPLISTPWSAEIAAQQRKYPIMLCSPEDCSSYSY